MNELKFAIASFVIFMVMIIFVPPMSAAGYLPSFLNSQWVGFAIGIGFFISTILLLKYVMR